jgi:hypothetical protein
MLQLTKLIPNQTKPNSDNHNPLLTFGQDQQPTHRTTLTEAEILADIYLTAQRKIQEGTADQADIRFLIIATNQPVTLLTGLQQLRQRFPNQRI